MLKMVNGTGIIGVDMICPLGVSTPQPPNYDRVELEGAGMLVLPNSLDAPLERLELGGKTEQVQTTGVNLFDEKLLLDFDSKNYDKAQSGSGFYYYKFPVSGTVTVSTKNANKNGEYLTVGIKPDGSDKTWLSHGSAAISKYKTLTSEDGNIYLGVNNNLERVKSMIQNTGGIIINEGSIAKPYEPYTGNKPSPSPEYPQEIKNSGKRNEETQKYEVDVKITNAEQNWSKEQSLTLTSDRPLTKWDRLVEQGGEIGWLYKSKVYDGFDGKNNRIELGNKVGNVRHFSVYFANTPNSAGNANSYCDKYIGVNVSWTKEKFGIFCDWNNGVKFFSAPNEKVTNLEEFKAWLIENPLGLAYETLETEFIPLPQSEQNAIRALKTYYPTTVITADGGELDPDIKLTYRKEI